MNSGFRRRRLAAPAVEVERQYKLVVLPRWVALRAARREPGALRALQHLYPLGHRPWDRSNECTPITDRGGVDPTSSPPNTRSAAAWMSANGTGSQDPVGRSRNRRDDRSDKPSEMVPNAWCWHPTGEHLRQSRSHPEDVDFCQPRLRNELPERCLDPRTLSAVSSDRRRQPEAIALTRDSPSWRTRTGCSTQILPTDLDTVCTSAARERDPRRTPGGPLTKPGARFRAIRGAFLAPVPGRRRRLRDSATDAGRILFFRWLLSRPSRRRNHNVAGRARVVRPRRSPRRSRPRSSAGSRDIRSVWEDRRWPPRRLRPSKSPSFT